MTVHLGDLLLAAKASGDDAKYQYLYGLRNDPGAVARVLGVAEDEGDDGSDTVTESAPVLVLEAGFTGTVKDTLGRERHYVDGKQVKAKHDDPKSSAPPALPRNDRGYLLDAEEIGWAKTDPGLAAELRAGVTNPAERAKLDAHLGEKDPPPLDDSDPGSHTVVPAHEPNPDIPDGAARPPLTPPEVDAIHRYVDWDYDTLNSALRKGGEPPANKADLHAALQGAFAKVKQFESPVTAHRALSIDRDNLGGFLAAAKQAAASGGPFPMGGYVSTSVNPDYTPDPAANVQLVIAATKGLDLMPYSKFGHERELLLDHGSEFRVTKVTQVGKQWHVSLEQVA